MCKQKIYQNFAAGASFFDISSFLPTVIPEEPKKESYLLKVDSGQRISYKQPEKEKCCESALAENVIGHRTVKNKDGVKKQVAGGSARCNEEKLADLMLSIGSKHPLYRQEQFFESGHLQRMREINKNLDRVNGDQKTLRWFYFSSLVLERYSGCDYKKSMVFKALACMGEDELNGYFYIIKKYEKLVTEPLEREAVISALPLFKEYKFIPGIWFLIKVAIEEGEMCCISPVEVMYLMKYFRTSILKGGDGFEIVKIQILVFAKEYKDIAFFYRGEILEGFENLGLKLGYSDKKAGDHISETEHFLSIVPVVSGSLDDENALGPKGCKAFSADQYKMICLLWHIIELVECEGDKFDADAIVRVCVNDDLDKLNKFSGKKSYEYKKFKKLLSPQTSDKDVFWEKYYEMGKGFFKGCSLYYSGILELMFALVFRYGSIYKLKPLLSAECMMKSARLSGYPMLYRNAGEIYMGLRYYDKARDCFTLLKENRCLNKFEKMELDNLIEVCEIRLETLADIDAQLALIKGDSLGKEPVSSEKKNVAKTKKTQQVPEKPERVHEDLTVLESVASASLTVPEKKDVPAIVHPFSDSGKVAGAIFRNVGALKNHASASEERHDDKAVTNTGEKTYCAKKGWLSDGNHQIQNFLSTVNRCRDDFDLEKERLCIEKAFKDIPSGYGRICEEVAWFYVNQVTVNEGMPLFQAELFTGDDATTIGDLCRLAVRWLSRSLACYLQTDISCTFSPSELSRLIRSYNEQHKEDDVYDASLRKRLRSVASSRGHIECLLLRNSAGKQYKKHEENAVLFYNIKFKADPRHYPSRVMCLP